MCWAVLTREGRRRRSNSNKNNKQELVVFKDRLCDGIHNYQNVYNVTLLGDRGTELAKNI